MRYKSKKPYKFSKKANRYISTSKTGTRDFYYKFLKNLCPFAEFDPHSTFGKYIMNKVLSNLRRYRHIIKNDLGSDINQKIKKLSEMIENNKEIVTNRRSQAVNERVNKIIKKRHPLIYYLNYLSMFIGICLGVVSLIINQSLYISFGIFVFFWIATLLIRPYLFNSISKRYMNKVYEEISNVTFDEDLIKLESEMRKEIIDLKNKYEKEENEKIQLKVKISECVKHIMGEGFLLFVLSDDFYNSTDWRRIRNKVLLTNENKCVKCGTDNNLTVDHILPRSKFPEKALDISNTQILCLNCNSAKGNRLKDNIHTVDNNMASG